MYKLYVGLHWFKSSPTNNTIELSSFDIWESIPEYILELKLKQNRSVLFEYHFNLGTVVQGFLSPTPSNEEKEIIQIEKEAN